MRRAASAGSASAAGSTESLLGDFPLEFGDFFQGTGKLIRNLAHDLVGVAKFFGKLLGDAYGYLAAQGKHLRGKNLLVKG